MPGAGVGGGGGREAAVTNQDLADGKWGWILSPWLGA